MLLASLLFQGLSGIVGGTALVLDPSGGAVRIPVRWLAGSPFKDYLMPGWILLLILGVFPLGVFYGVWRQRPWGRMAAVIVGVGLIIWIGVEILIVGYHPRPPLQATYGLLGLAIVVLASISLRGARTGGREARGKEVGLP